jgi:hypothetical protein
MRSLLILLVAIPAYANPPENLDRVDSGKPPSAPPSAPPATDPDNLDRAAISEGVAKVKPQIMACANTSKAKGTVKTKVAVAPSGVVSATTVMATPDPALGTCVAGVLKKATFRKTMNGGTFSYPFIF